MTTSGLRSKEWDNGNDATMRVRKADLLHRLMLVRQYVLNALCPIRHLAHRVPSTHNWQSLHSWKKAL